MVLSSRRPNDGRSLIISLIRSYGSRSNLTTLKWDVWKFHSAAALAKAIKQWSLFISSRKDLVVTSLAVDVPAPTPAEESKSCQDTN